MTFFHWCSQASSLVKISAKYLGLASILTFSFAQISHADLVQGSDENLTIDNGTGLIWLDVDFTTNISWNQMQTLLLPGGTFENFQLATTDEINTLYDDAGFGSAKVNKSNFFSDTTLTNLTNFLQLTGSTPVPSGIELTAQKGYNTLNSLTPYGGALIDRTASDIRDSSIFFPAINQYDDLDLASPYIGFYLVCKSGSESSCTYGAPEPSLLGLLVPSLIAIGYGARRRFNKD